MIIKNVINEKGFPVRVVVVDNNNKIIENIDDYKLKENEKIVPLVIKNLLNPKWNGSDWIESATEEEIKAELEKTKTEENTQKNSIEQRLEDIESTLAEIMGGM